MRNVELKARCRDVTAARRAAEALGARFEWTRRQVDTYFGGSIARMKLREEFEENGRLIEGTLIRYVRPDDAGPRLSRYEITPFSAGEAGIAVLAGVFGVVARVAKRRTLLRHGATRVHLDDVEGLGDFLEIERVLEEGEPEADGRGEVERLGVALGIAPQDRIATSYADLVAAAGSGAPNGPTGRSPE